MSSSEIEIEEQIRVGVGALVVILKQIKNNHETSSTENLQKRLLSRRKYLKGLLEAYFEKEMTENLPINIQYRKVYKLINNSKYALFRQPV